MHTWRKRVSKGAVTGQPAGLVMNQSENVKSKTLAGVWRMRRGVGVTTQVDKIQ